MITAEQVARDFSDLVARRGGRFVYLTPDDRAVCVYARGGQPSCAVGAILHQHGVPVDTLARWDETPGSTGWNAILGLYPAELPDLTDEATFLLGQIQAAQDAGRPYGEIQDSVIPPLLGHPRNLQEDA